VVEKNFTFYRKVQYSPIVQSLDGKVKAEVQGKCTWKSAAPTLLCNLVRLSAAEMIGVKFNKDKTGLEKFIGLFEENNAISTIFHINVDLLFALCGSSTFQVKLSSGWFRH
jgi:hypothetical protein